MRFLHTADWHLGRRLLATSLLEDQAYLLERLVELAREADVQAVIVAGDIYDHSRPPEGAVELLDHTLHELALSAEIPVLLIPGNHDSATRLGFGARHLERARVYIRAAVEDLSPIILEDKAGPVAFHLLPFAEPAHTRFAYSDDSITNHAEVMAGQVKRSLAAGSAAAANIARRVCVAHGFVMGGDDQESEAERPLTIGTVSAAPLSTFAAFQYTALGHLHRPHSPLGKGDGPVVRYAGSLYPYAIDEIATSSENYGKEKGVNIVDMSGEGTVSVEHISLIPKRILRRVEGGFDELLAPGLQQPWRDDYLVVKLTDRRAILDAMPRLRQRFPNMLALEPRLIEIEGDIARPAPEDRKKPMNELFSDFWRGVTETELDDEERAHLAAALKDAQASHEER